MLLYGQMFKDVCSLISRLSPLKNGGRESLATSVGKDVNFLCLALVVPISLQYKTTEWENVNSKMHFYTQTTPRKLGKNIFQVCRWFKIEDGSRSKLTIVTVGLRDKLVHHTSEHMYKMCVTQLNRLANAPRTKE